MVALVRRVPEQKPNAPLVSVRNAKGKSTKYFHPPSIDRTIIRCQRLNKDCQPSEASRKRKVINRKPATKVERLEEKLDGLVTLLKSTTQPPPFVNENAPSTQPVLDQLTPDSLQSLAPSPSEDITQGGPTTNFAKDKDLRCCVGSGLSLNVPVISPVTAYKASGTRSTTYHSCDTSLSPGLEPSIEEAEGYLKSYKDDKNGYFPILILPASTTARQLRQDRPFLWLCIMAISTKSSEQSKTLGREIRLTIGREILMEGKNNLDLLLGLLVYIAWYVVLLKT